MATLSVPTGGPPSAAEAPQTASATTKARLTEAPASPRSRVPGVTTPPTAAPAPVSSEPSAERSAGEVSESDPSQVGHPHEEDGAADACSAGQRSADLPERDPSRWHAAEGPALAGPLGESEQRRQRRHPSPAARGERAGDGEHRRFEDHEHEVAEHRELDGPGEAHRELADTRQESDRRPPAAGSAPAGRR